MIEQTLNGHRVIKVKNLSKYLVTLCPLCHKDNWILLGDDFSVIKCWNCKKLFMEDSVENNEIIEHYGVEIALGKQKGVNSV